MKLLNLTQRMAEMEGSNHLQRMREKPKEVDRCKVKGQHYLAVSCTHPGLNLFLPAVPCTHPELKHECEFGTMALKIAPFPEL